MITRQTQLLRDSLAVRRAPARQAILALLRLSMLLSVVSLGACEWLPEWRHQQGPHRGGRPPHRPPSGPMDSGLPDSGPIDAPCCGNGVIEEGETCDGNCDDVLARCSELDPCLILEYRGSAATCSLACEVVGEIRELTSYADGCCPEGGLPYTDIDCYHLEDAPLY